ncbi:LptA/OstA family protein [Siculibacillus lacustris]|uniref:LptA/OstA family protein n=1 Tax=Siculibacillus lacustris TaxID=1549641 RepID=UPI0019D07816|nr:LptA/OstA family protein [Siculibacillus lacustris]
MPSSPILRRILLAAVLAGAAAPAFAAGESGMSDAFKGFGSNTKEPIQIEANGLEVQDKDRTAVFTGNVNVRQKDTVLKTQRLRVFYEGKAAEGLAQASAGGGSQQIRRFEAEGRVLITQKDQTVTGETGWFDMQKQTAQIDTNVVLTQGKSVAKGEHLKINLKTGQYTLEGSRVIMILEPKSPDAAPPAR